jgi:putative protease
MQQLSKETPVGVVTHYWTHLGVAGVHLNAPLDVGDRIHVLGHTSDFEQNVTSMELDHVHVQHANAGADIGIIIGEHTREHDAVYKFVASGEMAEGESAL